MSKHAEAERKRLLDAATAISLNAALPADLRDRADDVLIAGTTLDAAARWTADLLLAVEGELFRLKAERKKLDDPLLAAEMAQEQIEAALLAYMDTGAPPIETGAMVIGLTTGRPAVLITDADALPAKFLIPQPAKPDKRAIAAAIAAKEDVPGAVLANSRATLRRTLKEKPRA